ncbi:hypothetical protein Syun_028435 [Stephania yunnanensis]|uniref:F-box/LRR-repeat protein 15-like leucin rich repeat domain-containing protein n=1 Tax=Stephania yunnanensis TaxID=152371 RepID=A0AAP0HNT9_9MAGN
MEISKRKLPPKLHGHLRRLGLLCENKDDGEIASEIHIFTSSCFESNVIGKFVNNGGGTCGQDSSLQDPNNNNTNPKCESATSKRLGNPAAAYPKGVECLKTCEGQLLPSKSLRAAMLKSRFADTILKAQQKTLSIGERVDTLKVKQGERERFEKKQREEKARIDAHVKAVKEEAALKLLRQRQAARLTLEEANMVNTLKSINYFELALFLILEYLDENPFDKKSFSLVCKTFRKAESRHRNVLRPLQPELLIKIINRYPYVTNLNLSSCPITDDSLDVISNAYMSCLRSIDLSGSRFRSHIGLSNLVVNCQYLVEIDLSNVRKLTDLGALAISKASNLEKLRLTACRLITDVGIGYIADGCRKLKLIDLRFCFGVGDLGVGLIAVKCEEIRSLYLSYVNYLEDLTFEGCLSIDDDDLETLERGRKSIKTLNLTNCEYVSLWGLPFLTSGAARLSYLNLTNGPGVTEALASSLLNLPNLQSIKLNGNVVDHSGLEAIGNCCILLRKLSLNKCRGVTDEGLSFLATKLKELRKLNISRCRKITEISVDNVTKSCTFLTSLKMKSCYLISKEAFAFIGERCHHLKKLDLTDTEVDDAGLRVLAKITCLRSITILHLRGLSTYGLVVALSACSGLRTVKLHELFKSLFPQSFFEHMESRGCFFQWRNKSFQVKLPRAKWSEEEKSDLVYKDQDLMEISKRKLPPKLHGHLRRLGLLCENKDDGEIASEIHIFTSRCFKSNVIGKFANTTGGTCGQDSSLKDLKNNNTNPKCESATSKRLGNPAAAYPKGSFGDMKSRCSYDNAFSEASSGVECPKTCEGQLSPSKSLRAAMLKSRFADTILKAQQKTLCIGERVDLLKVKQEERKDLKRRKREEKARIDPHVKAAKEEATLKLLRQRQAARLALEEFANNGGGTCGQDSSLQDPNNNNTNPKCESATSKRLGNPAAAYPKGVECLKTCEGQLSPSKSLHIFAMLKSRFADTILKAQQKTLSIASGERVDPLKVKQEMKRFEMKQREEKARINAHIKAAKEEAALKLLRQRQTARLALEEMEKSVDVYDSFAIMKDLEMMGVAKCIGHDRVLEGLGLYLKNELNRIWVDGVDVAEKSKREFRGFDGDYYVLKGFGLWNKCLAPERDIYMYRLAFLFFDLRLMGIKDLNVAAIASGCPRPEMINLGYCKKITDISLVSVSKCSRLSVVEIQGCSSISSIGITSISIGCKLLTELDIKKCHMFNDVGLLSLANFSHNLK